MKKNQYYLNRYEFGFGEFSEKGGKTLLSLQYPGKEEVTVSVTFSHIITREWHGYPIHLCSVVNVRRNQRGFQAPDQQFRISHIIFFCNGDCI